MRVTVFWPILLGFGVLMLAGCRSADRPPDAGGVGAVPPSGKVWTTDGPPDVIPPGLENQPDPIPRFEPPSARGNPRTYQVFGKTYRTMTSSAGYFATGRASWYGRKFHGRSTSSGEPYDMLQLTAAHRSLPLPTWLRVTNLENGRTTLVRVNDRGPFHSDRIIDLSFGAAYKLGFAHRGTARVRLEALTPGGGGSRPVAAEAVALPTPAAAVPTPPAALPPQRYVLQAGAFSTLDAADRLKARLEQLTDVRAYVVRVADENLYRVRLGPVTSEAEAIRLRALITESDLDPPMIIRD